MKNLQSLCFFIVFWAWSVLANIFFLPALLMPRPVIVFGQRFWALGVTKILQTCGNIDINIRGTAHLPNSPYILALKHQSIWDTIILHIIVDDPAIVMKDELLSIPIYGWYCRKSRMIPIKRDAGRRALKNLLARSKVEIRKKRPIVIFPQGTRVPPKAKAPYLVGISALYKYLNIPVVPAALNSGLFWPRSGLVCHPGTIVLELLEPIQPGLGRAEFVEKLENRIEQTTLKLIHEAYTKYPHISHESQKN